MDEVRVYNRALTATEIAALYQTDLQTGLLSHLLKSLRTRVYNRAIFRSACVPEAQRGPGLRHHGQYRILPRYSHFVGYY